MSWPVPVVADPAVPRGVAFVVPAVVPQRSSYGAEVAYQRALDEWRRNIVRIEGLGS